MGSVPNLSPQQSISKKQINPNKNQQTNKKLRHRLLIALAFMLPMVISILIGNTLNIFTSKYNNIVIKIPNIGYFLTLEKWHSYV